jgi:hypothetical protein
LEELYKSCLASIQSNTDIVILPKLHPEIQSGHISDDESDESASIASVSTGPTSLPDNLQLMIECPGLQLKISVRKETLVADVKKKVQFRVPGNTDNWKLSIAGLCVCVLDE